MDSSEILISSISPEKAEKNNCFKIAKNSCQQVFCKKEVLKNFAEFTGKHLRWSLFFNKNAMTHGTLNLEFSVW